MTILVTGATGVIGRQVVAQLLAAGESVRALTRRPAEAALPAGAEVVGGDLDDPSSLVPALRGVDRLYLFPSPGTAREVVALAKEAGVRRIVVLSAASVTVGMDTVVHPVVEEAVRESGLEWTFVRPAGFMTNLLQVWAPMVRSERVVHYPYGDDPGASPIHEADVAAVAVAALLEEGHQGKAYTLTGPARVTVREQVAAIGAALGEEVRYDEVSRERAREILHAQGGFAARSADLLLGFVSFDGGDDTGPNLAFEKLMDPWPDLAEALGRPGRTYEEWARDHAEDFR
ncbi:NAD(P)H-binding protein [Streptomyces sp. NPDC021093]|uniref:NAD(P)H-binding protein n=1 Tax=Streptomyces sp. NPDC021093 TaxID=3365112 RepID=UPI0037AFA588